MHGPFLLWQSKSRRLKSSGMLCRVIWQTVTQNFEELQHFSLQGSSSQYMAAWSLTKKALRYLDRAYYSGRLLSSQNTTVRISDLVLKSRFTIKWLDMWAGRSRLRIPLEARLFPPFQTVWTCCGSHQPSYSKGNGEVLSTGVNGLGSDETTCPFTNRICLCVSYGCKNELGPDSINWLVSVLETQYLLWVISKKS